ncbi:DUF4352 domain-containing protein [Rossellomorea vietnamensis]|uniref:DUF4352 domain-containing protein n=1 Tax=Rossellomorea vietnamensis TaxID=218284 RepID=A0A5D4KBR4_9BACI|nr:DUF4352 domain-containing protein [Rossellomorea vietnamensis]TYR74406.1 DUF4352 domain-containing protein [Rossellomorea vietnamensis]
MKKIIISTLLGTFLVFSLGACSDKEESVAKLENMDTPQLFDAEMGKPFKAVRIGGDQNSIVEITVNNYAIEQNLHENEEVNQEYDFAKFDVSVKNIGETTTKEDIVIKQSFDFFDSNGKEIERGFVLGFEDEDFKQAELRPDGVNEGTLVTAIPKGSVPAEVIYSVHHIYLDKNNQYLMKLN